jgi:hypothetical protein
MPIKRFQEVCDEAIREEFKVPAFGIRGLALAVTVVVGALVPASGGATAQPASPPPSPPVGPPAPPVGPPAPTTPPQQTHGYFGGPSNNAQEKQLQEINRQQPGVVAHPSGNPAYQGVPPQGTKSGQPVQPQPR